MFNELKWRIKELKKKTAFLTEDKNFEIKSKQSQYITQINLNFSCIIKENLE